MVCRSAKPIAPWWVTTGLVVQVIGLGLCGCSGGQTTPRTRSKPILAQQRAEENHHLGIDAGLTDAGLTDTGPDMGKRRVCLDPGHPSFEEDRLYEGILNRKVAFYLKRRLEAGGYEVKLTTSDLTATDVFAVDFDNESTSEQIRLRVVTLEHRVKICNDWAADFFISIHHNTAWERDRNYTLVLYGQDNMFAPRYAEAVLWAQITSDRLFDVMKTTHKEVEGDQNRLGLSLTVLEQTNMIGILTEGSFYSHGDERTRLNQNPYLAAEAVAIYQALEAFVSKTCTD